MGPHIFQKRISPLLGVYFFTWGIYFLLVWLKAVRFDAAGNVVAGHINIWGDWAIHFIMGSAMAYRDLFLFDSPYLINTPFAYPFFSNFLSAVLIRVGIPFFQAFTLPSFFFSCFLIWVLYFFYKTLLGSQKTALIASLIFLFSGGLNSIKTLQYASIISTMIIPQRAFTHGFPLTLFALALVLSGKKNSLIWAGVILSVMPLIHTHSFAAALLVLAVWAFAEHRFKEWSLLWVVVAAGAVPIFLTFPLLSQGVKTLQWFPGWYAQELKMNWIVFWWTYWGITPLLAIVGGFLIPRKSTYLPFLIIFISLNLFLFHPWTWDNTKLLVWACVGFAALAAHALTHIRYRMIAGFLFLIAVASGVVDAYRLLVPARNTYLMYTQDEIELADWVKKNTPIDSRWLTGTDHKHWLSNLTGRQPLITYPGWLWTHGADYSAVEQDVHEMYQHPERDDLYKKYRVDYIVIGPREFEKWRVHPENFEEIFKLIKSSRRYLIYSRSDHHG